MATIDGLQINNFTCEKWDDPELLSACLYQLSDENIIRENDQVLIIGAAHGEWVKKEGVSSYNCGDSSNTLLLKE